MLRRTIAACPAFIFLGLLSSVTGDEGFPGNNLDYESLPFFVSTVREKCLEHLNHPSCHYWDSLQYATASSESPYKPQQTIELIPESEISWKEISGINSQEDNFADMTGTDLGNHLQKRFTVYRRKSPNARGYKRGPGFRSWGGKRHSLTMEDPDKRSKFASWGGKRDDELLTPDITSGETVPEKRPKFQNWGGKKSSDDFVEEFGKFHKTGPIWEDRDYYLSERSKKYVTKSPKFQSWGGKRAYYPWLDFDKYFQFRRAFLTNGGEKRKFSSWGGKRYDEYENQYGGAYEGETGDEVLKRYLLKYGGDKRSSEAFDPKESEKTKQRDADGTLKISNLNPGAGEGESRR